MKYFLVSILFVTLAISNAYSQKKYEPQNRRIVSITKDERSIQATILIDAKPPIRKGRIYYWYDNDLIHHTEEGYFKHLLDGLYTEFYYPQKQLLCQGEFKNGLKVGTWKTWYENGNIKEIVRWKGGRKKGTAIYYAQNTNVLKKEVYRKGKIVPEKENNLEVSDTSKKKYAFNFSRIGKGKRNVFRPKKSSN